MPYQPPTNRFAWAHAANAPGALLRRLGFGVRRELVHHEEVVDLPGNGLRLKRSGSGDEKLVKLLVKLLTNTVDSWL